jgi:hypothetical protein
MINKAFIEQSTCSNIAKKRRVEKEHSNTWLMVVVVVDVVFKAQICVLSNFEWQVAAVKEMKKSLDSFVLFNS